MTSLKQIEANRRNALKSTGPKSELGKQISRRNAIRHGLTAETVIEDLEDTEDYKNFEAAVTSDYDAQSAAERELILRLASLLWRLRRATAIETGLFQLQQRVGDTFRQTELVDQPSIGVRNAAVTRLTPSAMPDVVTGVCEDCRDNGKNETPDQAQVIHPPGELASVIAQRFLYLADLDSGAFERLNRYETALWRQVAQLLFTLDALERRNLRVKI